MTYTIELEDNEYKYLVALMWRQLKVVKPKKEAYSILKMLTNEEVKPSDSTKIHKDVE